MSSEDALIERLLGEAEEAVVRLDWTTVQARCNAVLALEPGHERATRLGAAAARALGSLASRPGARRDSTVNSGRRVTRDERVGGVGSILRRAETAADTGDWPTVKDLAQQVLAIETDNMSAYLLVAEAEFGEGQFDDAARSLDSIIDMAPVDADARLMTDALLMAAEVAWERSDWKGVRSYAESVLDRDPENEEAQDFLDDVAHGARTGWLSSRWLLVGSIVFVVTLIALTAVNRSGTDSTRSSDVAAPAAREWSVAWSAACQAAMAVASNELKSPATAKFPGGSGLSACGYQQVTTSRDAEDHGVWTISGTVDPGDGSKEMQYVVEIVDVGDGTTNRSRLVSFVAAATPSVAAPAPASGPRLTGYGALTSDWFPAAVVDRSITWVGQQDSGRVLTFDMDFPGRGVDWTVARDDVLRLLPPDARLIEEVTLSDCKQLLYRSATLGAVFAQHDAVQTRQGDKIGNARGHVAVSLWSERARYNGRNVDTAFVSIGLDHVNPNGC